MIKLFINTLVLVSLFCTLTVSVSAQQSIYYNFNNTLAEINNQAPALNALGTGSFNNASLPDLSCLERSVYNFTQNSGVQFDNDAAGFFTTSYTFELYFEFTDNSGFLRLIDYKNRTSDFGLYATSTELFFYDELAVNTTAIAANQYIHLVISRDGTTEDVNMYLNGALVGTFNDPDGEALPDGSNVINFFQDDLVFGGEARPGNIALMKFYDYAIGDSAVQANFENLAVESGTLAFSPDIQSSCLTGNVFNFTNESNNTVSPVYTWEFGDGNSFVGTDAVHSYTSDGNYTVLLIADDGAGCIDTVSTEVVVNPSPTVDLGPDFGLCIGEQALLDAGLGFSSYLWNDGSTDSVLAVSLAGIYSVTVVDSNSCSAVDSIEVILNPDPSFSLGNDTTICFGATIDLSAPLGMMDYVWSTGETNQSITVGFSGVFASEVTSPEGCIASDTIEVTVNSDIIITLGNDTTICDGQLVTLNAGDGFQDYLWNDGSTDSTLIISAAGIYSVTVTDSFGCTKSVSMELFVNTAPVVDLGADATICGGSTLLLDAGVGFATYLWDDGSTSQTLLISTQGTYTVTVTDNIGCEGSDVIVITADPFVTLGNDLTLCDGQTATLDPIAIYTTYLWSDGSSTPTIDVTVAGIYTLTVTDINGCINSDEIEVFFNTSPIVDLGADIDLCDGDSVLLDAGTGFNTYLWSDGSSNQQLNVSAAGTYSITVTDLAGCEGIDEVTVNIVPLPVVNLGTDLDICDGTGTVLDAGSGLTTYLWSDGSNGQFLLVNMAGVYTVTVTNSGGCVGTDDITVSVLSLPVVTLGNDTILCTNDSLLVDAGAGFNAYLWNDGSTGQSIYVSAIGNYTVTVTDANGCQNFDSIEVDFYPLTPAPTITQNGNTLQSSSPTGNQWYSTTTGLIPGATNSTYDPLVEDTYYVIVTDTNGCPSEPSLDFIFVIDGLEQISGIPFLMAPNPANDFVNIIPGQEVNGEIMIEIFTINGKLVLAESRTHQTSIMVNISNLEQGIYFVRLSQEYRSTNHKLVITR